MPGTRYRDRPRAFQDRHERHAQLAGATGCVQVRFAIEAVAQRAEVAAAGIVGQVRRGVGAVDRIVDFAEQEDAGQALRERQQRGVRALRGGDVLQQEVHLDAAAAGAEAPQRIHHGRVVEQARIEVAGVDPQAAARVVDDGDEGGDRGLAIVDGLRAR
ncbi:MULTISPECIES: hypothetical protein [Lysobacteraceae]|uniref:hypothetical protein n=1 Tax=Lysobacteraceae TaxID=32033 RepID=UPI001FD5B408|nr:MULTISPECIES: hypothetical protein [Lysobacter]